MQYFKIRSKITGQYSNGGSSPSFANKGKLWAGLGPLKSHIRLVQKTCQTLNRYKDCEIVEFIPSPEKCKVEMLDVIDSLEKEMIVKKLKGTR